MSEEEDRRREKLKKALRPPSNPIKPFYPSKPLPLSEDAKLVKRIDEHGERLTPWEVDFVKALVDRCIVQGKSLSEGQRKICERIDRDRVR